MNNESAKDLFLAGIIFAIGLGAFLYIQHGPGQALQNSRDAQITFRSFPSAISLLLMLLSGLFAAASLRAMVSGRQEIETTTGQTDAPHVPRHLGLRVASLVALLIAFTQTIGLAPLFVLSAVFLFIAFFIFGQRNLVRMGVVSILGGAFFHGVFVMILNLPLN